MSAARSSQDSDLRAIDLSPRFRWRWSEHGIYAAVFAFMGLATTVVRSVPPRPIPGTSVQLSRSIAVRLLPESVARASGLAFVDKPPAKGDLHWLRSPHDAAHVLGGLVGNESGMAYGVGGLGVVGTGSGVGTSAGGESTIGLGSLETGKMGKRLSTIGRQGSGSGYSRYAGQVLPRSIADSAHESNSVRPVAIDPNGRFASTYRSGRGHVAGFDAALARHALPPVLRELTADVGATYAPVLQAPSGNALVQRVDLERGAAPPSGGPTHLRIAMRSSVTAPGDRPPLSIHVVLDASGSMSGAPLDAAKQAVAALVGRLAPKDQFSLVAFDGTATVVAPVGAVGAKAKRDEILRRVRAIQAGSSTNLWQGLLAGYRQARLAPAGAEWIKLVVLLSDGRPTDSESRPGAFAALAAEAFQAGVQTSALGLGEDYDGPLLAGLAERGAGGYYYLPHVDAIARALAVEIDSRLQPVAQALEVRVRLRPDVRLTRTYGSRRLNQNEAAGVRTQERAVDAQVALRDDIAADRQSDVEGGMRFFIPGFARDDHHVILLGLDLPGGASQRDIATVEVRYKDRLRGRNVAEQQVVRVRYADSDAESAATVDRSVAITVHGFAAGETLLTAGGLVESGRSEAASLMLAERALLLRRAAAALGDPRLEDDASRIDRLRTVIAAGGGGSGVRGNAGFVGGGEAGGTNLLLLGHLLNTSGRQLMQ